MDKDGNLAQWSLWPKKDLNQKGPKKPLQVMTGFVGRQLRGALVRLGICCQERGDNRGERDRERGADRGDWNRRENSSNEALPFCPSPKRNHLQGTTALFFLGCLSHRAFYAPLLWTMWLGCPGSLSQSRNIVGLEKPCFLSCATCATCICFVVSCFFSTQVVSFWCGCGDSFAGGRHGWSLSA